MIQVFLRPVLWAMTTLAPDLPVKHDLTTPQPVAAISRVFALKLSDTPATYQIGAAGTVPTAGWTEACLVPEIGEDGVQTFRFVAVPPDGPVAPGPEWIEARIRWTPDGTDIRRARVRAGDQALEIRLPAD